MNFIDRVISVFSPKAAFNRMRFRAATAILDSQVRKYDAASGGRRTDGWRTNGGSPNTEVRAALTRLRERHRDMVRNNPYAENAVARITNNTVGAGIRPSISGKESSYNIKRVKKYWRDWAETKSCDYDGQHNFYGLQAMAMRAVVESGEVLIRKRRVTGQEIPIKLQVVEADLLDHTKDIEYLVEGKGWIIQGIEFDSNGKRVAYWMYERHPDDALEITSKRIPADDILHIYYKKRPGQVRGVPFGTSAMMRLKDFDDYEDAELVRQKIAACFSVFIEDTNPDAALSTQPDASGEIREKVEPGIIEHLPPGKSVTFAQPPTTQGYEAYSRKILQGISAGYGTSYEALTNDLTGVNFSSGRMGWLEFQRNITDWQENMLVPMLCDNVWSWFMESLQIIGAVSKPVPATWTPPRREMIDPKKEVDGMLAANRAGYVSWQETVRQMGYDPDLTLEELKSDFDKFTLLGLVLESDPRNDVKPTAPPSGAGAQD
jgi:lambda family phage portal protein